MNKYITLLCMGSTLLACNHAPQKNLNEFKSFIGKWEGNRDGMTLVEIWKEQKPSSISGEAVAFTGKDTLFHEKLALEIQDTTVFYTSTTPNSKTPVPFMLVSSE